MKPDALALQAEQNILLIRKQRVMLSHDLARLYGVPVKVLNQTVRRNRERFPDDFMFQLDNVELGEHRHHACICAPARNASHQC